MRKINDFLINGDFVASLNWRKNTGVVAETFNYKIEDFYYFVTPSWFYNRIINK